MAQQGSKYWMVRSI